MAVTGYSVLLLQTMTSRWCTCGCYRLQCVTVTDDGQQLVYVWLLQLQCVTVTDDDQQVVYVWLLQVTVCYCYRK